VKKTLIDRLTRFQSAYVLISRPSPTITREASEETTSGPARRHWPRYQTYGIATAEGGSPT
jgi:hypothetical protein